MNDILSNAKIINKVQNHTHKVPFLLLHEFPLTDSAQPLKDILFIYSPKLSDKIKNLIVFSSFYTLIFRLQ